MLKCVVTSVDQNDRELSWFIKTEVTLLNNTKSSEKLFLHVAFSSLQSFAMNLMAMLSQAILWSYRECQIKRACCQRT